MTLKRGNYAKLIAFFGIKAQKTSIDNKKRTFPPLVVQPKTISVPTAENGPTQNHMREERARMKGQVEALRFVEIGLSGEGRPHMVCRICLPPSTLYSVP